MLAHTLTVLTLRTMATYNVSMSMDNAMASSATAAASIDLVICAALLNWAEFSPGPGSIDNSLCAAP